MHTPRLTSVLCTKVRIYGRMWWVCKGQESLERRVMWSLMLQFLLDDSDHV